MKTKSGCGEAGGAGRGAFSCLGTCEMAAMLPPLPSQRLPGWLGVGGLCVGGCRGAGEGGQQARPAAEHSALTPAGGMNFFCRVTRVVRVLPARMCSSILLQPPPSEGRVLGHEHRDLGMGLLRARRCQASSCPPCPERAFNSGSLPAEFNPSFPKGMLLACQRTSALGVRECCALGRSARRCVCCDWGESNLEMYAKPGGTYILFIDYKIYIRRGF